MGAAHTGSMDPGDYSRLQNSLPGAASNQADPSLHLLRSREEGTVGRDRKAVGEAGHKPSRSHRRLHKQYISSSEKGEPVEVDTQPESPKHVYNTRAFQDGRYTLSEGSPKQRRLHVQARFKRCIPVSANQCSTSEIPPISMGGSNVSLQCSTVWASNCTSGVYEASETCPSSSPSQRTETSSVFGRHPNNWQEQSRGRESISPGQTAIGRSWICDQSGKITTKSNTMHRVFGIHSQLPINVLQVADSQIEGDKEQMQASIVGENAINTPVGSYHRCLVINSPCDSPSTSTLSRSSNTKNQKFSPPPLIRINDSIGGAECHGFELVDQQSGDHQWETNSLRCSRDDDRIRCIQYRLESLLEEPEDGRSLVIPGISTSYQCEGVACCFSSPTDLRGEQEGNQCPPKNRQHDRSLLYQLDGWYPLQTVNANHISDVELELGQENSPVCRTPPRRGCRSGITKETGQLRMEARPDNFSTNHANSGPLSGGSFCLQNISSTSNIHELETRSRSSSDRRVEAVLDEHKWLCLSSFCIDRQVPIQDSERESQRVNTHCTSMANSAMVCSSPVNVVSETTPPAETRGVARIFGKGVLIYTRKAHTQILATPTYKNGKVKVQIMNTF